MSMIVTWLRLMADRDLLMVRRKRRENENSVQKESRMIFVSNELEALQKLLQGQHLNECDK